MGQEREDHGVYVYTAHDDAALAVDDLGGRPRRAKNKPTASPTEGQGHAPTLPAPMPEFDADDLAPAVPVADAAIEDVPALGNPTTETAPATPDPDLAEIERMVARGDWAELERFLHARGAQADDAPAHVRLLWSVSAKESGAARTGASPDAVAIAATAALLGVDPASPLATVVGKRLVRRRTFVATPAPKPWISWLIVLLAIVVGATIGLLFA